jgi:aquaporin Z
MKQRKLIAEAVGTALLVFVAVGVATTSFGFKLFGTSQSAGVVTTAFAFGFVLLVLAYALGPVSGCHINPAVTLGFLMSKRMQLNEAIGYWVAQVVGGIVGALVLFGVCSGSPSYSRTGTGLGADGFGKQSMLGINTVSAFIVEVILTAIFVFIVLNATRNFAAPQVAGVVIGLGLTTVHLVGIPFTGTSVNPARSIGPALIVGHAALSQLWLFIIAPMVGAALAALVHDQFYPVEAEAARTDVAEPATPRSTHRARSSGERVVHSET